MSKKVRVRFAPSPTGPLHMGGVRTALYNYLFARKNGGDFILRIEDTDQKRWVQEAEGYIIKALEWCGINPDESIEKPGDFGPYRQSDRAAIYKEYADKLITSGDAYYAFDTTEELEEMRSNMRKAGKHAPQYNHITRNSMKNSLSLSSEEVEKRLKDGEPYVIRVKVPRNTEIKFNDMVRGWVLVESTHIDDKVLFKSDGLPTYHIANVIDDHLMEITHVIRGEEWLPSAPLHVLLYKILGWENEMPQFAHLPLILRPDGNGKLSKRDGDRLGFPVFPLNWTDPKTKEKSVGYKERGYYPEAFTNILAFLGWNPGTEQELFNLEELIAAFDIKRVGKAGAKFDPVKAKWYNQQYLRKQSNKQILADLLPALKEKNIDTAAYSEDYLLSVCELMKERATFVKEIPIDGDYFFNPPEKYDEKTIRKKWKDSTSDILNSLAETLSEIENFKQHEDVEKGFKQYMEEKELGFGKVMPGLRLVLTGKQMGPSLFEIMSLIGKEETMRRIQSGIKTIEAEKEKIKE